MSDALVWTGAHEAPPAIREAEERSDMRLHQHDEQAQDAVEELRRMLANPRRTRR